MPLPRSLSFGVNMPLAYTVFMFPKHFSAIRAQLGLKPLPIEKLPPANVKRREHNTHTAKARVSHISTTRFKESSHSSTVTAIDVIIGFIRHQALASATASRYFDLTGDLM